MGALKRIHPLPPCPPPPPRRRVRTAKPHRYRLISFFQIDGPSSSLAVPLWYGARRGLEVAVRRSAGALAATRQQSCGCAYSDVRWGVLVLLSILLVLLLFTSVTEGVEMFMRLGVVCLFGSPARTAQALVDPDSSRLQIYVDDPVITPGDTGLRARNTCCPPLVARVGHRTVVEEGSPRMCRRRLCRPARVDRSQFSGTRIESTLQFASPPGSLSPSRPHAAPYHCATLAQHAEEQRG